MCYIHLQMLNKCNNIIKPLIGINRLSENKSGSQNQILRKHNYNENLQSHSHGLKTDFAIHMYRNNHHGIENVVMFLYRNENKNGECVKKTTTRP